MNIPRLTLRPAWMVLAMFGALSPVACIGIQIGEVTGGSSTGGSSTGGSSTGGVVGAGILVVSPTTLDFGHTLMNTTQTLPVMLTNTSATEVDSITCPVGDGDSTGFTVDNCPGTLAAGASIQVGITFAPGDGQASSFVKFNGSEGETALLLLQGEPVATAFTFSPEQLDFGYLPPATSVVECLTASNQANAPFAIDQADLDFEDAGAFALSASDNAMPPNSIAYPLTISAGGSAKICYSFAPSTAEHQYAGQTMIATDDPNQRFLTIGLFGWGGGPQITCTPTSIDFGPSPINDIQSVPVTCANTGTAIPGVTLTIGPPTVMSSAAFSASFDPTTNPYPAAGLAPGQKAQIDAIYLPTAVESDTGTLMIPSNGGQGQGVSISLGGEGTN